MGEWIEVGDYLPAECEDVLCFFASDCGRKYVEVMYISGGCWSRNVDVTHWMPLPEPPKDGK